MPKAWFPSLLNHYLLHDPNSCGPICPQKDYIEKKDDTDHLKKLSHLDHLPNFLKVYNDNLVVMIGKMKEKLRNFGDKGKRFLD